MMAREHSPESSTGSLTRMIHTARCLLLVSSVLVTTPALAFTPPASVRHRLHQGITTQHRSALSFSPTLRYRRGRLYETINGGEASVEELPVKNETIVHAATAEEEEGQDATGAVDNAVETDDDSLKNMLKFAIPALGIYLSNPLLSNIDNGTL